MKLMLHFRIVLLLTLSGISFPFAQANELLPVKLTPAELERESKDWKRHPFFMKALRELRMGERSVASDPRNRAHIPTSTVFFPNKEDWKKLFHAAVKDRLTLLRAFSMFGREVKRTGAVVFGPGKDFEDAVQENHADLGLAMPAKYIGASIWYPDPSQKNTEFQAHIKVFYTQSYVHEFPDEILPANLKIAQSKPEEYWLSGARYLHPTVTADVYDGLTSGVGIRNVRGVGGQKRGFVGFLQNVLFFLPDAVSAMVIREEKDELLTEALVNTVIEKFESTPKYAIRTMK